MTDAASRLTVPGPVVVTGAASGIGLATAAAILAAGASVAMMDRDEGRLADAAKRIDGEEGRVHLEVVDVADEAAVELSFERLEFALGTPRGLVTSAGVSRDGVLHTIQVGRFDEVIATNLRGTFLCARAAVARMTSAGAGGSVVCVSSPLGRAATPRSGAYGASKAGVCALVRSLAVDYGAHGIRANALLPGPTETELMWADVPPGQVEELRATVGAEVPLGRLAEPGEPAAAALWLLSDQASYVTGAEIPCDGGVLAKASVSI